MKKIAYLATAILALSLLFASCKMEPKLHQNVDATQKSENAEGLRVKLNGAMSMFGAYQFMGRNVFAIADICSDVAEADPSAGHFVEMYTWTFSETTSYLAQAWTFGYDIAHNATLAIIDGNELLAKKKEELAADSKNEVLVAEVANIETNLSQLYALKAYCYFYMVNLFAKPYSAENQGQLGLVLIPNDKTIKPKTTVKRATVKETYDFILDLLAKAQGLQNNETSTFYPNAISTKAFEARVHLYMREWQKAADAAEAAIALGVAPIENDSYVAIWGSLAENEEFLFSLKKASDDNLSANSLNNLYGGYRASVSSVLTGLLKDGDCRKQLVGLSDKGKKTPHPRKFDGSSDGANVNNVPLVRASEVYLIAAEAYAQLGDVAKAQQKLFEVAKRDASVKAAAELPGDKAALLSFIADEGAREFFCEGHRLFDLRRTEAIATINGKAGYKPYNFVFPIPAAEVNAGFLEKGQDNPDWKDNLPKK